MSSFGRRVELARKERGLTRKQLSSKIEGLSASSLRDLEVIDATPRGLQKILPQLAQELGKSIQFLLTGSATKSFAPIVNEVERIEVACTKIKQLID